MTKGKAWLLISLGLIIFWSAVFYLGYLTEVFGVLFTLIMGLFAYESAMIVHEQKQSRFDKNNVKYRDGDNT